MGQPRDAQAHGCPRAHRGPRRCCARSSVPLKRCAPSAAPSGRCVRAGIAIQFGHDLGEGTTRDDELALPPCRRLRDVAALTARWPSAVRVRSRPLRSSRRFGGRGIDPASATPSVPHRHRPDEEARVPTARSLKPPPRTTKGRVLSARHRTSPRRAGDGSRAGRGEVQGQGSIGVERGATAIGEQRRLDVANPGPGIGGIRSTSQSRRRSIRRRHKAATIRRAPAGACACDCVRRTYARPRAATSPSRHRPRRGPDRQLATSRRLHDRLRRVGRGQSDHQPAACS